MFKNYFTMNLLLLTIFVIITITYILQSESNKIPLKVLFGSPVKSNPQISPDGKQMAYLTPNKNGIRNIWVKTIGLNDDKPVTEQNERDIIQYLWAFDNQNLFYLQDGNGCENYHLFRINKDTKEKKDLTPFENTKVDVLAYKKHLPDEIIISMNLEDKKLFDVYKLDLKTDNLTLIAKNNGKIENWIADWNNNILGAKESVENGATNWLIRENQDSKWKILDSFDLEDSMGTSLEIFSKDGKFVYATSSKDANTARLIKIDTKTLKSSLVFEDPQYDSLDAISDLDTGELLAGNYTKEKLAWVFFDDKFKNDIQEAMKLDTGDMVLKSRDNEDKKWIVAFLKDNGPFSYWFFNRETKKSEFLFYSMPELAKYKLANMEPFSFASRDGLKINGYLTLPANKDHKNLPTILVVHGGPWARDMWGYRPDVQFFANRGYAVLQVNFRGSTGYGKNFLNAGNKEWGKNMQNDLTDAANWAISTGVADPKKIAIYGASYGGYAALAGATFTPDLFCCAIDIVGPSNLITLLQSIPPYWSTGKYMFEKRVGNIETEQEFLKSISPLFSANKIKIPVMVIQGANDPRVRQAESEQIVEAMKKNGVKYEYMLFTDEGHGLLKEVNRMKFYEAAEKFLKKYLG